MSERILMPLDGSKTGEAALPYVNGLISRLAPGEAVEITLLHVITNITRNIRYQGGGMISVPCNEDELAQMTDEANKYLLSVGEQLSNKQITLMYKIAVNQNPAEAIIEAEKESNANLVTMATHGRSGISRFTLGSIAEKVMRGGNLPVLMVRASTD
ncbi:MAG: universal stress protein [Desulfobulbaceae bacterium]|nr:universal stress protein [Desulfobulbaceae bacterium]